MLILAYAGFGIFGIFSIFRFFDVGRLQEEVGRGLFLLAEIRKKLSRNEKPHSC